MTSAVKNILVKSASLAALIASLAASPLTAAAAPAPINPSALGAVDAVIHFCVGVDPSHSQHINN